MSGFTAEREGQRDVRLRWRTAAERGGAYEHLDRGVPEAETLYYRLAQRDRDGAIAYSEVRAVRLRASAKTVVDVLPEAWRVSSVEGGRADVPRHGVAAGAYVFRVGPFSQRVVAE